MTVSDRWRVTLGEAPIALKPGRGRRRLAVRLRRRWLAAARRYAQGVGGLVIADVLLGCVLEQLLALKQSSGPSQAADQSADARPVGLVLPYATPGSPGYRLAARANAYLTHWRDKFGPCRATCDDGVVCAGLAMLLALIWGAKGGCGQRGAAADRVLTIWPAPAVSCSSAGSPDCTWAWPGVGPFGLYAVEGPSMGLALLIGLGPMPAAGGGRADAQRQIGCVGLYGGLCRRSCSWRGSRCWRRGGIAACGSMGVAPSDRKRYGAALGLDRFAWIVSQGIAALAVTYWSWAS